MNSELVVLFFVLVFFFVVGLAIFLVWKFFEPTRKDHPRTLMEFMTQPAVLMAGGVVLLGILIVFPRAIPWILGALAVLVIVETFVVPELWKADDVKGLENQDPASRWPVARLVLAVALVFGVVAILLEILVPK